MYPGTHAALTPDKPAVVHSGTGVSISYAELDENSIRLARYLHEAGLRPGDDVAMLTDNDPRCFEVYWAAMRSGLYITAVNRYLTPAEAAYILNDCGARVLVISANFAELAAALVPLTPHVEHRLVLDGSYSDALASVSAEPLADQPCGADMLYSSGTTGRPKGIKQPLPERQVDEPGDRMVALFGPLCGFDEQSIYLSPAPIYHAAPLRFGGVVQALGGTVVLMPRFDAEAALAAIEKYQVTHSQWVPTMFVRMLKLDEAARSRYDLSSQRVAIHAAAPCPVDVKQRMIDWWGPILFEYYSCTESIGATVIGSADWLRKPGSVGRAGLGIIHVCGEDGAELPAGEIGVVYWENGNEIFRYHNDAERTADATHPDHPMWTTVGDIGRVDEDGYLFLTDRKAFMIISGGVNVYPQEIEDCFALHPKVDDVAVIGVPDEEMGEAVKAVVQPAPGVVPGPELAEELLDYARARIAHYKCPRTIDFSDDLPRTPTGKLVKGELRERYLTPELKEIAVRITAAVLRDKTAEHTLETVELADPGPDEVIVRISGVGLCHTDMLPRAPAYPAPLPLIAGHEGSGVVTEVGANVTGIAVGDHVIASFDSCGGCANCLAAHPAYCATFAARNMSGRALDGSTVARDVSGTEVSARWFGQSSFASHALVTADNLVVVDADLPLEMLGPLGCGVQTGAASVFTALGVRPGESIVVFGVGAVGLSAVMAARVAGATTIVAVDRLESRLELATELGATHALLVGDDLVGEIHRITNGGAQYTVDTTGVPDVILAAVNALRVTGTCGLLGVPQGEMTFDPRILSLGKTITGIIEGDAVPRRTIPALIDLWRQGRFPFDRLVSTFPLERINEAEQAMARGDVVKPVLIPSA